MDRITPEELAMIGTFGYRKNCSLVHFIPQGEVCDGCSVIVFPKKYNDVVVGETYDFTMMMTREATYVIDGETYRVAHAIDLLNVSSSLGDVVDTMLHCPIPTRNGSKISDHLDGDTVAKLAELRAHLS